MNTAIIDWGDSYRLLYIPHLIMHLPDKLILLVKGLCLLLLPHISIVSLYCSGIKLYFVMNGRGFFSSMVYSMNTVDSLFIYSNHQMFVFHIDVAL